MTSNLTNNYMFGTGDGSAFRAMTGTALVSGGGNILLRATGMNDVAATGVFDAVGSQVVVHFVYDNISAIRVYANGVLINTVNQPANLVLTGSNFTVGGQGANNGLPTGGRMDEFRMYNRALSQAEISATWNVDLLAPTGPNPSSFPPIANFAYNKGIDTVWVNSPYAFVNNSIGDSANYWDIIGMTGTRTCIPTYSCYLQASTPTYSCYLQASTARNFRYTFIDTGWYQVKLVTRNRSGRDSITKDVYVGFPSKKPVANFFMDKFIIGVSEQIPMYDLSENGPTSWNWYLKPDCIGCNDPNVLPNDFLPSANTQLPVLRARNAGKFDVCLRVSNSRGVDSVCRKDYIQVIGGLSMCAGPGDTVSFLSEGYVYDNGGPNQPYFPNIMGVCTYSIAPCAGTVTAFLERFRLRNIDTIIFRNGSPSGPVIRRLGGGNLPDSVRTITATSGRLFMQWQLGNTNPVGDSGIVIRWTSTPATYGPPVPSFTCPDTVFSQQNIQFINTTQAQGTVTYNWDLDGNGIFGDYQQANGANFTFTTVAPILRDVCVDVTNCKGTTRFCKRLFILPVQTRPIPEFSSPRPAGFVTDVFRLIDQSRNGPNQWRWVITPDNVSYLQGTTANSQNPVFNLTYPGRYNVRLVTTNAFGVDSIEKGFFLDVLSYNAPFTDFPIANASDIGITRVRLADMDTTTPLKTPTYHALNLLKTARLFRGVNYVLEVSRPTGVTPMERKAWIDYNLDADFLDAGEEIMSESMGTNPIGQASVSIPNNIAPGRIMRLRIGVSEGATTLTPDKARSGCFEDYSVEVGLDAVKPTITLKGPEVLRVQRATNLVDPGATAMDNLEGDISARVQSSNDVNMNVLGVYTAKYWVSDLYGNVSDTITRTIQVEINQQGPTITLNGPDTIFVEAKLGTYTELGATAVDNTNQDITSRIVRIGMVNTNVIGTYTVNYSVIDAFGFTSNRNRAVIVRKTVPPTITTVSGTPVIKHQINAAYTDAGIVVNDHYFELATLTLQRLAGSINVTNPGSYNLTYRVCDPVGNCSAPYLVQVDVQDTLPPVVSLRGQELRFQITTIHQTV
ncbi:MAG: DUF5011 domain-containing protein [Bacteroidia bacterium]|nr:DUF5011 domain-containing protein [Bacteroidia bacterium]